MLIHLGCTGRSAGCVLKAVELTSGDLSLCQRREAWTEQRVIVAERATEVSSGRISRQAKAERPAKAQTVLRMQGKGSGE